MHAPAARAIPSTAFSRPPDRSELPPAELAMLSSLLVVVLFVFDAFAGAHVSSSIERTLGLILARF